MVAQPALERFFQIEPFPQPDVMPTRYPVVLMHGFGMLAALNRAGQLHDVAMDLRSRGVLAYAPNVAPYDTIEERSDMWQQRLWRVQEESKADRMHLIAHSMGGLDARYLVHAFDLQDVVASITTVSTPHRGTAIAEIIREQPDRVQQLLADLVNRMGEVAMAGSHPDASRAVEQLTPAYIQNTFNPATPNHEQVLYRSFAGRAGRGTDVPINPFLRPLNAVLYEREGVNDGYVSVRSARWGAYQGLVDADHTHQIGIKLTNSDFKHRAFYRRIVNDLRTAEMEM